MHAYLSHEPKIAFSALLTENEHLLLRYPTILGLAGANASDKQLPLDGFDQWEALQRNSRDGPRKVIYHNVVPTGLEIVNRGNATHPEYTSNTCMKRVDPRVNSCHAYGATGAAIRVGDIKLLVTHNGSAPWGDSVPQYPQFTPGGKYPNGSHVFQPVTHDTTPSPFQGVYYLFNMSTDPTESVNLAKTRPDLLNKMIKILKEYEDADDTIIGLSYYYGFPDPKSADNPGGCEGPFIGSHYCAYGNEFACIIKGEILKGTDTITTTHTDSAAQCQGRCDDTDGCGWWSYQESSANRCSLFSSTGSPAECEASDDCAWGKREGCAVSLSSVDDLAVR
uniref:Apple domain-containing protein n=1 Tax=Lotharella globosa TaxID=91324 RepID=A0A7S3YUY0_9EUKA